MGSRLVGRRLRDATSLLAAAAVVLTARASLADHYAVPSGSMEPTVMTGDHVIVAKLAYGVQVPLLGRYVVTFGGPARGDVVVLDSPEDGRTLLKRVVAVGGDEVAVHAGRLVLNGVDVPIEARGPELYEKLGGAPHLVNLDDGGGPDYGPMRVPVDALLVMGDHRGNSHDGRDFGFVPRAAVRGRVVGVVYRGGALRWLPIGAR